MGDPVENILGKSKKKKFTMKDVPDDIYYQGPQASHEWLDKYK